MNKDHNYNVIYPDAAGTNAIIKVWNKGVQFEQRAVDQLVNISKLPFVRPYVAAMPDCHWGNGATVGSVIPTEGAIIPAAVGVDIGCGMMAVRTNLTLAHLEDGDNGNMPKFMFEQISKAIPTGRTNNGGEGDRGAWHDVPEDISQVWKTEFSEEVEPWSKLVTIDGDCVFARHPGALSKNAAKQLGTLGTGNHFIEVCVAEDEQLWVVIHSGSRGFGNRIGSYFTNVAKKRCAEWFVHLPDPELAFFPSSTQEYKDYISALMLAQKFAWRNREIMMQRTLKAIGAEYGTASHHVPNMGNVVHCHHNYMAIEQHFGKKVILTRKGAVRAEEGDFVIIPGSMGARTYIARGLGSPHSFKSCSHGAGRAMGRNEARKQITLEQHIAATAGVACHKGAEVIDESPAAYKDIEAVMAAQSDLVEPVVRLKQIVCVKGIGDSDKRRKK
jgi:tRNA-splicing ligase RtcB